MNDQILATAFKLEADALAEANDEFRKLDVSPGLSKEIGRTPALTIVVTSDKVYRGAGGFFTVALTVESAAADGADAHHARVQLVIDLFLYAKAARLASINARAVVRLSDYAQVPGRSTATHGEEGAKFRTTLTLRCAAQIPAPV